MATSDDMKKVRAANLTAAERETIVDLALKYRHIIENKKTDAVTAQEKEAAWKAVAELFNSSSSCQRNHQQIRQAYENQKKRAKKAAADDKVERLKTGGGTFIPQVGILDEKLLAVLGNRARPLVNAFDSDALYHTQPAISMNMIGNETAADVSDVGETSLMEIGDVGLDGVHAGCSTDLQFVMPTDDGLYHLIQSITVPSASTAASASLLPPPTAAIAETSRKWTGRRRPGFTTRLNPLAARSEAAAKIGALSDEKRDYYRAKLEMRRLEHEQRMKNLRLEEQVLTQQLKRDKGEE